jgi:hypothetical protein
MLEPAALAKPIIFGTYVFNFAEISTDLLNQNAAIQVQNADELFVEITRLLTHDNTAESLGNNALQYLQSKQGATDKLMQQITSRWRAMYRIIHIGKTPMHLKLSRYINMHRSLISSKCQRWFLLASMSSIKE